MSRPEKQKRVCKQPSYMEFGPLGNKGSDKVIVLTVDEYETVRRIDLEGLSREECAMRMNVARTTAQAIYNSGKAKIADCLVNGARLQIEGGNIVMCDGTAGCPKCYRKEYTAVVFDMDGIIFDSEKATMDCWIELANKYNIENIEEPYFACIGTTMARTREIMLETYGEDFPYDDYAKEASAMYHERYDGGKLPMKKGVVELLSFLKNEGKKIALASSTRRQTVVNQLKDANILEYFDAIVTGDMVENSKPAPDIFLKACEELSVLPEDAYAIEDSYNGIKAANAGGLRPIMVPDLLMPNDEMKEKSWEILSDLLEVKDYFTKQ